MNNAVTRRLMAIPCALAIACAAMANQPLAAKPASEMKVPDGFEVSSYAYDVDLPVAMAFLPDGRMLLAEKGGMLKLIEGGRARAKPVIDLRNEVNDFVDRGLLGLAVDPNFTANGFVYLMYAYDAPGQAKDVDEPRKGRLVRYVMRDDAINPRSGVVLFDDYSTESQNHSVGDLHFAPDGALFVSLGDGSLSSRAQKEIAARSQRTDRIEGKVLRLDPMTGAGLPGNPSFDPASPKSAQSRLWARGFRNPYRFAVNPNTGLPHVGNVGWWTYEALQVARPGTNFGWPCTEGPLARPEYNTAPECAGVWPWSVTPGDYDYPHNLGNASLTAGDFNTGYNFPPEMRGNHFFGDYSLQWMRRAVVDENDNIVTVLPFAEGMGEPVEFEFSADGELYYLPLYQGEVRKITYKAGYLRSWTPVLSARCEAACATPDGAVAGAPPLTVTFSAGETANPKNETLQFAMTFGDAPNMNRPAMSIAPEAFTTTVSFSRVYTREGAYTARLYTRAENGMTFVTEKRVTVGAPRARARVVSPGDLSEVLPGASVGFVGEATDAFGAAGAAEGSWWITLVDGPRSRVLANAPGNAVTVTLPADMGPDARVTALFSAKAGDGPAAGELVRLYAKPADAYIRAWWMTRAYSNRSLDDDALDYLGGESRFIAPRTDPAASLVRSESRNIDFKAFVTPSYKTVAYAFTWVDSPEDRTGFLGMNSDDGIAAWLNGEQVWKNKVSRFVPDDTRDIDLPPIKLKKGRNALLIKVNTNDGDWQFKARILNPDGSIMKDVAAVTR